MKSSSIHAFRKDSRAARLLGVALAGLIFGAMGTGRLAASVVTMTFFQSGSDVDETGSGTVNLTGLTL